jgi:hypothetical protein
VAITVVTSAAGAMVAGSADLSAGNTATAATEATTTVAASTATTRTSSELEALVKACLATKDPQSAECATAVEASTLSREDFWAKVAMSLDEHARPAVAAETPKTDAPKTELKPQANTRELLSLVAACVESHERASGACDKALTASGLDADAFWAKVGAMVRATTDQAKAETATRPNTEALTGLVKDCLAKYAAAKSTAEGASLASEACRKAIEASGLSSSDFWARFGPKPEPTRVPEPSTKPKTTRTSAPANTVSTAQLEVMVRDCFAKYLIAKNTGEGAAAASEACERAIQASGLDRTAFFAKLGTPGSKYPRESLVHRAARRRTRRSPIQRRHALPVFALT